MNAKRNSSSMEDRVGTVMVAIANAEPDCGMQQRIAAAVYRAQQQPSHAQPAAFGRARWLQWPVAAAVFAVLAVAATTATMFLPRTTATPSHEARVRTLPFHAEQPAARLPQPTQHVHTEPLHHEQASWYVALKNAARPARLLPADAHKVQQQENIPEPPEPLTKQERLLVQMVRRNSPVELALLTHAAREQELHREREEVREFFAPPPSLPLEEGQP